MPSAKALWLEVGCGKGKFTVETARQNPDVLLVAVERVQEAMLRRGGTGGIFCRQLGRPAVFELLRPVAAQENAKRRLTHRSFLQKYENILAKNGEIHFKTDNAPLFEWSLEEFEACGLEIKNLTRDLHADARPVGIMTGYEENSMSSARRSTAASL